MGEKPRRPLFVGKPIDDDDDDPQRFDVDALLGQTDEPATVDPVLIGRHGPYRRRKPSSTGSTWRRFDGVTDDQRIPQNVRFKSLLDSIQRELLDAAERKCPNKIWA